MESFPFGLSSCTGHNVELIQSMGTGIIDIPSLKFKLDLCVDVNYTINLLQSSSLFTCFKRAIHH